MERKGERVGGVNENGSVFGWREWRDGGDHAGQRIIEENSKREREKRLSERRVLGVEGRGAEQDVVAGVRRRPPDVRD